MGKCLISTLFLYLTIFIFCGCGEKDCSANYSEGFNTGKNEGYALGKAKGENEGYNRGKTEGFQQGSNGGYTSGYNAGVVKDKEISSHEYESKISQINEQHKQEIETVILQGKGTTVVSTGSLKVLMAVLHLITLAGIFGMAIFIVLQVRKSDDWVIRSLFVLMAFFIVFLLIGVKFSPIDSIASAFGDNDFTKDRFWRILIELGFGGFIAMVIHLISWLNVTILERYMVLLSTLVLIFFLLIYIEGWSQPENLYLTAAFLVGVAFYVGTFVWDKVGGESPLNIFQSFYDQFK